MPRKRTKLGWHIPGNRLILGYGDAREIKIGRTLKVTGIPDVCIHGLHACPNIEDVFYWRHGNKYLDRVSCSGRWTRTDSSGKFAAQGRKVLWRIKITRRLLVNLLRAYNAVVSKERKRRVSSRKTDLFWDVKSATYTIRKLRSDIRTKLRHKLIRIVMEERKTQKDGLT